MIKSILTFRSADGKYEGIGASTVITGASTESVEDQARARFGRCAYRLEHYLVAQFHKGPMAVSFFENGRNILC